MEGAEGYDYVPDGRFVVCYLKKALLEVVQIKRPGKLRQGVSIEERETSTFRVCLKDINTN